MYKKKRKKYLRSSHVDGKREIACFHVETASATGKREKWRENRGHVVIFAVRVSRIRDAKSLYYCSVSVHIVQTTGFTQPVDAISAR